MPACEDAVRFDVICSCFADALRGTNPQFKRERFLDAWQAMTDPYRTERVRRAYVDVTGPIWMPPVTAPFTYKLSDYDLENIGDFTHENIERWLCTHAGDFQYVSDFHAVCGSTEIPWSTEESEFKFSDCMYPSD